MIQVEGLSKSYQQGDSKIQVLHQLGFDLDQGETLAIVGQSGSGKSTLLSLLAGLDHADSGAIKIHDQNLSQLSEDDLAQFRSEHLGIVFQQFHLVSTLNALENVALPLQLMGKPDAEAHAAEAIQSVGLSHRQNHLPHQLSGGERQRVAIARAFVVSPNLLLADEPSGNLDQETGDQVMDLLFKMVETKKMTLILVTHNSELAKRCDRTLHLKQGQLH